MPAKKATPKKQYVDRRRAPKRPVRKRKEVKGTHSEGKREGKRGRPRIEINWKQVDMLCAIDCTGPEIAAVMGVHQDTMTDACKRDHGILFSEYIAEKRLVGNVSVRRWQWKLSEMLNPTMLIWQGKNRLGQSDKVETKAEVRAEIGPVIIPDNDRDK